jgi:nicotinamidase-related amidase
MLKSNFHRILLALALCAATGLVATPATNADSPKASATPATTTTAPTATSTTPAVPAATITFHLKTRAVPKDKAQNVLENTPSIRTEQWRPGETAIIICDMWTQHGCKHATTRINELAPQMNRVLEDARAEGIFIVHAPSGDQQNFDKDYPEKPKARLTTKAFRKGFGSSTHWPNWEHSSPSEKGARFPVNSDDGGCSVCGHSEPLLKFNAHQTPHLTIKDEDSLTDDFKEIIDSFRHRGIKNVIIMGVHTNMCIIGRPFGLRAMKKHGFNVVLMRDMTDLMYNNVPGKETRWPNVKHFEGLHLVVAYIETYISPTVSSTDITGAPSFQFKEDTGK